jgi:CheY-like chemotaxis protein
MMTGDDRDILAVLKSELEFVEKDGYGLMPGAAWKAGSVFRDSPVCINFGEPAPTRHCRECLLWEFVPGQQRSRVVPCHQIPLNPQGDTVQSLMQQGRTIELKRSLQSWLLARIRQIETARASVPPTRMTTHPDRSAETGRLKRVLLVDNSEPAVKKIQRLLEDAGYETTVACGGGNALRLLQSEAFDLILLDDYSPQLSSGEILRQAKRLAPETPVILMYSANLLESTASGYARLGVRLFVNKFNLPSILAAVQERLPAARPVPKVLKMGKS